MLKNLKFFIVYIVIMFTSCIVIHFGCRSCCREHNDLIDDIYLNHKVLTDSINKLNSTIDSLEIEKLYILKQLDSIENKIVYIDRWYEKSFINITNQSISEDAIFFNRYISENSTRFTNSNNSDTIKTN